MSGSGGGNNFLPDFSDSIDCKNLRTSGSIVSPNPAVLTTVSAGDILDLTLNSASTISAITQTGAILGNLVATKHADLLNCLTNGTTFQARITSILGGHCELQIFAI